MAQLPKIVREREREHIYHALYPNFQIGLDVFQFLAKMSKEWKKDGWENGEARGDKQNEYENKLDDY